MVSNKIKNAIIRDKLFIDNALERSTSMNCPHCEQSMSIFDDKCKNCGMTFTSLDFEDKNIDKSKNLSQIIDEKIEEFIVRELEI